MTISDFLESIDTAQFKEFEAVMLECTRRHFQHEEQLMREIDYPEMDNHIERHKRLLVQLAGLSSNFAKGQFDRNVSKNYLTEWLLNHIGNTDSKLAEYIEGRKATLFSSL
jgi:hemerythrin-like metal-binding protein